MAQAVGCVSQLRAFDEPSSALDVQEELEVGKLRKVRMHVGRAVLRSIPFFSPQLDADLADSEEGVLQIRLPPRCSANALKAVFQRMHVNHSHSTSALDAKVEDFLQMAELAQMLCLEGMHAEYVKAIECCVHTELDVKKVVDYCASVDAPPNLARLAKRYERKGIMLDMEPEFRDMILNAIEHPGDGSSRTFIERLFEKRARKGTDMIDKNMAVLRKVFTRENRSRIFCVTELPRQKGMSLTPIRFDGMRNGTAPFLQLVGKLAISHPKHFNELVSMVLDYKGTFTRGFCDSLNAQTTSFSVYGPLEKLAAEMLDKLPVGELSGDAAAQVMRMLLNNGHSLPANGASLAGFLKRVGCDEQIKVARALVRIDARSLAQLVKKSVLESFIAEARIIICKGLLPAMSFLDAATRTVLEYDVFGDSDG